jgi:hypothetical protein
VLYLFVVTTCKRSVKLFTKLNPVYSHTHYMWQYRYRCIVGWLMKGEVVRNLKRGDHGLAESYPCIFLTVRRKTTTNLIQDRLCSGLALPLWQPFRLHYLYSGFSLVHPWKCCDNTWSKATTASLHIPSSSLLNNQPLYSELLGVLLNRPQINESRIEGRPRLEFRLWKS